MCITADQLRQAEAIGVLVGAGLMAALMLLWMDWCNKARDLRIARRLRDELRADRDELRLRLDYVERMDVMAAATRRALQGRSSR